MSVWRQLKLGFRTLTSRTRVDQEISEELRHYLEESKQAHIARGLSVEEAERTVRQFGSAASLHEQVRSYGWENIVEAFFSDLRIACRQLRALPIITTVAVLTIALGIGITTAIFGSINPILFESLPYPHATQIVTISEFTNDGARIDGTFGMFRALTERSQSFDAIAAYKPWHPTMTGTGPAERFNGQRVGAAYFDVFGTAPFLGRSFRTSEDRMNGPNVILISWNLWQRRFHAEEAIQGRVIRLDDTNFEIIGVMPKDFEDVLAPAAEIWSPLQYDMSQGRAWGHHLRTIGRLRTGITYDQATGETNRIARDVLREQRPETYGEQIKLVVKSLQKDITSAVRPALLSIMGAAVLVLLIACVNVTNLLLTRSVQRQGEFAMRAALGAGRARIIRQLLTESLLLAFLGGAAGLVVAFFGVQAVIGLSPPGLPRASAIAIDRSVFVFALTITTLIGLFIGVIPARQTARSDVRHHLQNARATGFGNSRIREALVVGEVALALVLLVSSGLLWRSLNRLFAIDPGFDSANVLTMQIFDDGSEGQRFFEQTIESVRQIPGVASAALTSQLPLSGDLDEYGVHFQATPDRASQSYGCFRYSVSPGYIETMGIPLRHGRSFHENDRSNAPFVALISESLAKLRFQQSDPTGHRLRIGPTNGPPYTIVGVVADVKQMSLAANESFAVYIPAQQWQFKDQTMSLVIRAQRDAATLAPVVRAAVGSIDPDQPIVRVATMDELLAASASERRFALILFQTFALAALLLAAAGIYGVLAGTVAQRTREIGVRSALGASRRDIVVLIVRKGITLTGLGVAIGFLTATVVTQGIVAILFQISRLDPPTYFAVVALLFSVAIVASGLPAWRASRIDPAITLRAE
ncbi:ABC transporter permease [bacterium]|nr:ABC transporter permease [bacterium]MCI0602125.1 ABC transporter permease [bacterium]